MLTSAGNINQEYEVIGLVQATVTRAEDEGCSGSKGLPIDQAYNEAFNNLVENAKGSGADGLIHINFDHRVSSSQVGCGQNTKQNIEIYSWGTAIMLKDNG